MKNLKRAVWALSLALCCASLFVGCSDDDDNDKKETEIETGTGSDNKEDNKEPETDNKEPETGNKTIYPKNVFTGKLPKSYAGSAITYDSDGLVTKIENEDEIVTFDYNPSATTKATDSKRVVRMIISFKDASYGISYFDMTIGDNDCVERCKETNTTENEVKTWEFEYNEDGQLNYMVRSENDNRKTNITYVNGDITKIEEKDDKGGKYSATVTYGEKLNVGNVMMFDFMLGIDMDEMQLAYCIGLLGKATKHLPASYTDVSADNPGSSSYSRSFLWEFGSDDYPKSVKDDGNHDEYHFTWN